MIWSLLSFGWRLEGWRLRNLWIGVLGQEEFEEDAPARRWLFALGMVNTPVRWKVYLHVLFVRVINLARAKE